MAVKPVPEGYRTVTPYLIVKGADQLLAFVKAAFGADETLRMPGPDGTVGHAEVRIGDSIVMLADASEESAPIQAMLHLYVDDCDATYARALEAGATSTRELKDEFYGDRTSAVRDAFGNQWFIATHIEDVSEEETIRRGQELAAQA